VGVLGLGSPDYWRFRLRLLLVRSCHPFCLFLLLFLKKSNALFQTHLGLLLFFTFICFLRVMSYQSRTLCIVLILRLALCNLGILLTTVRLDWWSCRLSGRRNVGIPTRRRSHKWLLDKARGDASWLDRFRRRLTCLVESGNTAQESIVLGGDRWRGLLRRRSWLGRL
jgi:hypothetical protein